MRQVKTREFLRAARKAAFRLQRSGAEPWVPSNYPAFLAIADEVLDAAPDHLRPAIEELMTMRASAHAALQRISAREDHYVGAGCFANSARYRTAGDLLFAGPSLYSRSTGYVSVNWELSADERRFAEESFDDYEALVDARQGLSWRLMELCEDPPVVGFSLQALMEHADEDTLRRIPVSDLFAFEGSRDERRLLKYLKTFDTARKAERRREDLECAASAARHRGSQQARAASDRRAAARALLGGTPAGRRGGFSPPWTPSFRSQTPQAFKCPRDGVHSSPSCRRAARRN